MNLIPRPGEQWKKPKTFLEARGKSKEHIVAPRWNPNKKEKRKVLGAGNGYIPPGRVLQSGGIEARGSGLLRIVPGRPAREFPHIQAMEAEKKKREQIAREEAAKREREERLILAAMRGEDIEPIKRAMERVEERNGILNSRGESIDLEKKRKIDEMNRQRREASERRVAEMRRAREEAERAVAEKEGMSVNETEPMKAEETAAHPTEVSEGMSGETRKVQKKRKKGKRAKEIREVSLPELGYNEVKDQSEEAKGE